MGESGVVCEGEGSAGSGLDRRRFIARAGLGTAIAGASWIAPSVVGTSVAFAQGSDGDDGGGDDGGGTTTSTTIEPGLWQYECSYFPWPQDVGGDPTGPGVRAFYPIASSLVPDAELTSVTSSVVGLNPPSVHRAGYSNTSSDYRNLMSHTVPYDGAAALPGPNRGLILVQDNAGGGNTSESSIGNYQEVTVTFNQLLKNVIFWVYGFSASTVDGNDQSTSAHRDTLGFDRAVTKVDGGVPLTGAGTFGDPLRLNHLAPSSWATRFQVQVPGPLQSFTMRYATVGGTGEQKIKLDHFSFGAACIAPNE